MGMGENIRRRRLELGMTQEELASKIGVQKSAVAKYESGRVKNIKRAMIATLAKALECDPVWLMDIKEESPALLEAAKYKILFDKIRSLSQQHLSTVEIMVDAFIAEEIKEKEAISKSSKEA